MNKTFWYGAMAFLVVAAFLGKYVSANFFGPSDRELIHRALEEAIQASREGRPGGVMDKLTDKFKVNSEEPGNRQIANFIKESHPDITIPDTPPLVSEDTARITAPVTVKVSYLGFHLDQKIDGVSLVFQRESAHEWIFVPVKKWRLAQVFVPQAEVAGFAGSQD